MKYLKEALTFDDVLIVPGKSSIQPNKAKPNTLTKNKIEYPFSISCNGYCHRMSMAQKLHRWVVLVLFTKT